MNWTIILAAACGIAVTQGFFLGVWLLVKDNRTYGANLFLGMTMLALSLRIGKSLVYYFWSDMSLWGVGIGGAGLWAVGPSLLFYVLVIHGYRIRKAHLVLYLPSIFMALSAIFFNWRDMHVAYQFGILYLMSLPIIGVLIYRKSSILLQKQPLALLTFVLSIGGAFIYQIMSDTIESYALGAIFASLLLYAINYVLMTTQLNVVKSRSLKKFDATVSLEPVLDKIKAQLEEDQLYRRPKLTLSKLSETINEPVYMVRQAIVQLEGKNFNEYINGYRINEVIKLLESNNQQYTIEGMALNVGFTSTSSFYEAFKRITDCTPVEYKKKVLPGI